MIRTGDIARITQSTPPGSERASRATGASLSMPCSPTPSDNSWRTAEVEDRLQAGHWEGDLIMGAGNRSAIGTLVERTTRFLILLPFTEGVASAEGVRDTVTAALANLPAGLRRTLTWDQGKELALHPQITAATGTDVFFCEAHSPWQRGSNESMNGLLRDYFPKGTDLSAHTAEDIVRIAAEVNDRPRKTLGWQRPAELFAAASTAARRGSPQSRARVRDRLRKASTAQQNSLVDPLEMGRAASGVDLASPRRPSSDCPVPTPTGATITVPTVATLTGFLRRPRGHRKRRHSGGTCGAAAITLAGGHRPVCRTP